MSEQTVTLNTGDEGNKGPSIEEQYKSLVDEGVIDPEGENPGGGETNSEGSNDDRPEWLPEKFKSPAEMARAYAELEKKLSSGGKGAEEATADQPDADAEVAAAEEATKKAGLDLDAVSAEFNANQGLSAETYDKLAKAGYPREMVDIYIEGLMARSSAVAAEAYAVAGSQEDYGKMIDWAIDNLDDSEQQAFDAAINSNNKAYALMAIKGLKARMDAAVAASSSEEPSEQISRGGKVSGNVYESTDDYMEDVNDPRYETNETFRSQVMAKLGRSKIM